jgi:Uma2 family endonuclease
MDAPRLPDKTGYTNIRRMNVHQPTHMSIGEFVTWAQKQGQRFELVGGVPRLQPNVKLNHSRIATSLAAELVRQIDPGRFEFANCDFAIRTGPETLRFADGMVVPAGKPGDLAATEDAIAIFEILSKSTMHEDFGAKRAEYLSMPALKAYVIFAQDEPHAWVWQRDDKGYWPESPQQCEGRGEIISLPTIGASLALEVLYRAITV